MSLRAGVIGLGPHGQRVVTALANVPGVELTAVVDRRDEALSWDKLPASTKRFRTVEELWAIGIDLACITTNGPSHASLAAAAMEHGVRRLMIAKPMGCSLDECDAILHSAKSTQTRIVVDHIRRHAPAYLWLHEKIACGDWGTVRCLWTQRPGIGLGCLATHSFDAVRFLTGLEVTRVTGWVDPPLGKNPRGVDFVDPGGTVVIELGLGARAVVSQIEDGAGPASVEIDLTAGRVRLDEKSGEIEVFERDLSVVPCPGRPAAYRRAAIPEGLTAKIDMQAGLVAMLAELVSSDAPACDAVHGRASIEVLVAAHLSHRRGNVPVALPNDSVELRQLWLPIT